MEITQKKEEGEFYTPDILARFSHKVIADHFGDDWKEKYIVWDPAWGGGNLTSPGCFQNLYASTLHQEDLDAAEANPEASKFKFDFLNDPIKSLFGIHIPEGLYDALENDKPIIFLMNPPYATTNDMKDGSKDVNNLTYVQGYMGNLKVAKMNLFSQFLYRIIMIKDRYNLTNVNICVFSSSVFMSGSGYEKFRKVYLDNFTFIDGYLMNASLFDNCSKRWGVSMSLWKLGKAEERNEFIHKIIDIKDGDVVITGEKNIYNIDGQMTFRKFCKEPDNGKKTYPTVTLKNPVTVGEDDGMFMTTDAIAFYVNNANNVYKSMQSCYIMSTAPANVVSGFSITKDNFLKVCTNFASRKVVTNNWINNKDEFMAPTIHGHTDLWSEFIADSIVYSIFNTASCQTAIKEVDWKNYKYRIRNEFFFMSKKEIMEISNDCDNQEAFVTCFNDQERYAYELLSGEIGEKMSSAARNVLECARELVRNTFKYRNCFNNKRPELFINNWDAGYYQMRPMWKEYDPEGLKNFRSIYKELGNKLRKQVYELKILK